MTTPTDKSFELLPLLSLLNKDLYLEVQQSQVDEIVNHVCAPKLKEDPDAHPSDLENLAIDYIADNHPRLVEAAALVAMNRNYTINHYNKMIDLYRKFHIVKQIDVELA